MGLMNESHFFCSSASRNNERHLVCFKVCAKQESCHPAVNLRIPSRTPRIMLLTCFNLSGPVITVIGAVTISFIIAQNFQTRGT